MNKRIVAAEELSSHDRKSQSKARVQERVKAVRRRRIKRRAPRLLWLVPAAFVFCALSAMMASNFAQYRKYQAQADFKDAQLASLQNTQSGLQGRLSFLQMPKGREQVLLEHGFIKPNQRVLLVPAEKPSANFNASSSTESPDFAPVADNDGGTAWQRTARTFSGWMQKLRGH